MTRRRRILWRIIAFLLCVSLLVGALVLGINVHVIRKTKDRILSADGSLPTDADCILVLGCAVNGTTPSPMLADRLTVGVSLYRAGVAPKLLMSGDHGRGNYNEVAVMKLFAMNADVPSGDVFMDHAGFSTYESLYRAKAVFGAKRVIIVTQTYHLYRALYLAEQLGLEAYGVAADLRSYVFQVKYDAREALARVKDTVGGMLLPVPQYLGPTIPLSGDGNVTNDEAFQRLVGER